ncbi:hypothetical protein E2C01_072999 [Portunus trituberculatus]|uniref:Uncharacterized protein n=1 Tax=Portunus trituberculatus TaxID=210409 RepID=A0A5B7HZK7_PORTR|nr:hypothetical protein [Portunus trituberculatus]
MCPSSVQNVRKMRYSSNMVLFTLFGSTVPDRVNIVLILGQCPRYRLEQDILQFANNQYISLGSARRELLYRQKAGTVSPKPLKGLTKRHCGSAESIDLAQPKESKVSPGVHVRDSSRDRSAMVAPVVSVQPCVTPSVSDRASCDDVLSMETSDDIVTAVHRGHTVSKSAVQPDPRLPMTGKSDDVSHHSPVG